MVVVRFDTGFESSRLPFVKTGGFLTQLLTNLGDDIFSSFVFLSISHMHSVLAYISFCFALHYILLGSQFCNRALLRVN